MHLLINFESNIIAFETNVKGFVHDFNADDETKIWRLSFGDNHSNLPPSHHFQGTVRGRSIHH
jgi:hypothetical protein